MKYLLLIVLVFIGYKFYDSNAVASTGITIVDKIKIEPVTREEVIDFVLPELYATCSKLPKKDVIEQCNYRLNYQKPYCLKYFNLRAPELFNSEDQMADKIASLTNCMVDEKVF